MPDHIRGGAVKGKEYSRASASYPFSTRAAKTTILGKRRYDGTPSSVPRTGSVMDGLEDLTTPGQSTSVDDLVSGAAREAGIKPPKKVLPQTSPPQPPSFPRRFPPLQAPASPSRTRGTLLGREPQNLSPADHSRIRTPVTSSAGFGDNGKVDEGLRKPNEVDAMALVFKRMKGKAWKSLEKPVLVVSSTISKDNTAGEEVQRAKLLCELGRKMQCKKSTFGSMPPQSLSRQDRLDFASPVTFGSQRDHRNIPQTSRYWSVPEATDFPAMLRYFGTDWHGIAKHMTTKTHIMVYAIIFLTLA